MKRKFLICLLILCVAAPICSCHKRKGEPGTVGNPLAFYFMPLKGEDVFNKYAPLIKGYIENNAGLAVKPIYAKDFITIIEAFGKKRADAAFMNTLGYLMAHDWAKAEAYIETLYGDVYKTYHGEILARTDSKINSVEDLAGKKIAFADPFSASGYLYALKLLNDKRVVPGKVVFAGGHKKAIEMLYKGEVDAAATYHSKPDMAGSDRDARIELLRAYPDIISKIKIIALTDEIPNGPIAFSHDLPEPVKTKLAGALMGFARTVEGRDALINLYNITGLTVGNDADYDGVRKVLKDLGKSADEVVPGGITFYRTHVDAWLEY
jgi:phosphonate transport system substrate-binding protein